MIDANVQEKIKETINSSKVVLFMKGTPDHPACGFSSRAISILKVNGITYPQFVAVNVLDDDTIRNGIKDFSQWPTIPQLYVNGEFIGGSDIMTELNANGELSKILND